MNSRKCISFKGIDPSILILELSILIGVYLRLFKVLPATYPLNDGGLFYTMVNALMENGFRLPLITSYNHLNIPFAYPPFSFYLSGFLADLTSWEVINIIRILPAVFSILTIPAFYFLASALLRNRNQVILATIIFTFVPSSFNWLIMGGGLTRSPAFFFYLLALFFIHRLYTQNRMQNIVWASIFSTLTILTHPEAALHTAASALVFFIIFGRNKKGVIKSIIVAGLTILVTAPWWVTVLNYHGMGPFFSASESGFYNISSIVQLLKFDLTYEYGLQTIGSLGLIGLFLYLAERKNFLPIWLFVTFISDPRSAPLYVSPCLAILASYSLCTIFQIIDKRMVEKKLESSKSQPLSSKASKGLFLLLFCQWFFSSIGTVILLSSMIITDSDKIAFDWIKLNTPAESKFLVLTTFSPLTDPVSEWFPALTDRTSIATLQGHEWDNGISFDEIQKESINVQKCFNLTYLCVESWAEENHKVIDYIYIRNHILKTDPQFGSSFDSALGDLSSSQGFTELVYRNDDVSIYKVK